MKDIHLHGFHAVEIAADYLQWNEVPGGIDHQAAPGKARLVLNHNGGRREPVTRNVHELQKSLQPMQYAERVWRREFGSAAGDFENIRFVFAYFLNFFAGVVGVNDQRGLGQPGSFEANRKRRLPRQLLEEAFCGAFEARLGVASQRHEKGRGDAQASSARPDIGGYGQEIQRRLLRAEGFRDEKRKKKKQEEASPTEIVNKILLEVLYHVPLSPFQSRCTREISAR